MMKVQQRLVGVVALVLLGVMECSSQWVKVTSPYNPPFPNFGSVTTLAYSGANLFAGTNHGGVYLSTDAGMTWTLRSNGLGSYEIYDLGFLGTNLYAATYGGLFRSTDLGVSWTASTLNSTVYNPVSSVFVNNGALFCSTYGDGAFISVDNSANWTAINSGLPTDHWVSSFAAIGIYLFAGTDGGVFRSTNNGSTWSPVNTNLADLLVNRLAADGSNLLAGTNMGTFLSSDNGDHWYFTERKDTIINDFAVGPGGILAATVYGVFLSKDHGMSWTLVTTGALASVGFGTVAFFPGNSGPESYVFASAGINGLWRRPLSELITSAEQEYVEQPGAFALRQNYPNPFNPVTQINYTVGQEKDFGTIPKGPLFGVGLGEGGRDVQVQLTVYDILGREAKTLVNEPQAPGHYQVRFDGAGLSSGVYLYRLTAGSFMQVKRMMLVK